MGGALSALIHVNDRRGCDERHIRLNLVALKRANMTRIDIKRVA